MEKVEMEKEDWRRKIFTGRRKTSVARVRIIPGEGKFFINHRGIEEYFPRFYHRFRIEEPLKLVGEYGKWDVYVNVYGGGITGQADAIRLGIARALSSLSEEYRKKLRKAGMLTRDPRMVERKKYGRKKARKSEQYSKR